MPYEPDAPDPQEQLDALDDLPRVAGWRLVVDRICDVLEEKRNNLESASMLRQPEESNYLRGMIAGLNLCLGIPEIMQTELKSDLQKQGAR